MPARFIPHRTRGHSPTFASHNPVLFRSKFFGIKLCLAVPERPVVSRVSRNGDYKIMTADLALFKKGLGKVVVKCFFLVSVASLLKNVDNDDLFGAIKAQSCILANDFVWLVLSDDLGEQNELEGLFEQKCKLWASYLISISWRSSKMLEHHVLDGVCQFSDLGRATAAFDEVDLDQRHC